MLGRVSSFPTGLWKSCWSCFFLVYAIDRKGDRVREPKMAASAGACASTAYSPPAGPKGRVLPRRRQSNGSPRRSFWTKG